MAILSMAMAGQAKKLSAHKRANRGDVWNRNIHAYFDERPVNHTYVIPYKFD